MTKRKTFGKLLVVSLFIMLFVLLLTISTSAATHDVTTEAELTTALTNAADGDTINVTADITTTAQLAINKSLTLTSSDGHTLTAGGINVVASVDLTLGGNLDLDMTGSIRYTDANAGGTLTITDSANVTVTGKTAVEVTAPSVTVILEKNASLTVSTTGNDQEGFYFHGQTNSVLTIKDNASLTTAGSGQYCHGVRIGSSSGSTDYATLTVNLQGSTAEGDAGVSMSVARGFDVRTSSSLTLNGSGKVNLTTRRQVIYCASAVTKSVVNFTNEDGKTNVTINANGVANANGVTETEGTVFATSAATSTMTLNGTFNISGTATFAYLNNASAPFAKINGDFTVSGVSRFLEFQNATNCGDLIELNGDLDIGASGDFIYVKNCTKSADAASIRISLTGDIKKMTGGSGFYVETTGDALVDIDVAAREGNTTDKFVYSGWRLINFRENTTVDLNITTNEIDVTTTERTSYCVGCTDIDLTFKADTITFTTGASKDADCYFAFNNYPSEKANVNLDGNISFVNTSIGTDAEKSVRHFGHWSGGTVLVGLTLRNMEINSSNAALLFDNEASFPNGIVFDNCSGTLEIAGTLTAPQIHVKGGSMATVITGTANLSGLGNGTMQGGLLYSNGATGSITISGSGVLNHNNGHGIEINGCSNTVTVKDSGSIISAATANDRETFNIVNGANPTIYIKDNAILFTPNDRLGHAFRIGKNDANDNQPANATIYIQGSTAQGDTGIDIDVCRVLDIRNLSSATVEITGKVDINVWRGVIRANDIANAVYVTINGNVTMNGGTEDFFYLCAKESSFNFTGDYTIDAASGHFLVIKGQSDDANHVHVANLIGNFNISMTGCATSHSLFYVEATGSTLTQINVKPREGNTTDKLVFDGGRLFNFRENTDSKLSIATNEIRATCAERLGYTVSSANVDITFDAPTQIYDTSGTDATMLFNGGSNGDVSVKFNGNVSVTTKGVNFFVCNTSNDVTLNISGSFEAAYRDNLIWLNNTITGAVKLDVDCATLNLTGKRMTDINSGASIDVDVKATGGTLTGSEEMLKIQGIAGTGTVDISGGFTATGYTKIVYITAGSIATTFKGSVSLTASANPVHYSTTAAGSVTITDSVNLTGTQVLLEGSGKIDMTISGTPTITLTSQYDGLCHKATGDAIINLSGVWSTNKTIFYSGGKKSITISGADTHITAAMFYAKGCVVNVTVQDGTITHTGGDGLFTSISGGTMNVIVNGGNITAKKYFGHAYNDASVLDLTVNGGTIYSGSWFLYYGKNGDASQTATGTVKFNGGSIGSIDHMIVNFGSGKVDFTMIGGTVAAPASFIYYENQTGNNATKSTVSISGGTFTGGHLYVFKKGAVDITVSGNANLNITKDWAFQFQNEATGSVTLKDNAVVTSVTYGFVNNGTGQVNFTIQDNASFTTANDAVYYGGNFPAGVVNTITIAGGTISAENNGITVPGTGTFTINMTGGTVSAGNNGMMFAGRSNTTLNLSGGTVEAINDPLDTDSATSNDTYTKNIVWNISGGTLRSTTSGYAAHLRCPVVTANITGGSFYAPTDAALHVNQGTATVYGGYFEAGKLCCARADGNGSLTIYGGTFYYTGTANAGGMPVRSGTGSSVGNVNIYGGNYYTDGTGTIFCCMNSVSNLTIYGGFNAWGGRGLVESSNPSSIQSSGHGIGDMWTYQSITMATGAAVRIVEGSSGLRFMGTISAEDYAHLVSIADEGSISFGTLIAPVDYVQQLDRFTKDELDRMGLNYLNIAANDGLIEQEDGSYVIRSAITNIKEENRDREFAAVCYVTYTVGGNEVTTYANYRETKNARSIEQVARLALQDGRNYTENQLAILNELAPEGEAPVIDIYLIAGQSNAAGCSDFDQNFLDSNPNFTNGYSNIYYSGVAAGGNTFATKNFVEIDLVKAGYGCSTSDIGAELGMAEALSKYYNPESGRVAAIVKYGYGGTALADSISGQNYPEGSWCPPSWLEANGKKDEVKSGGLYRAFVKQIESSISDYRAMGYDVNIVAAYWMQGESDRTNQSYAAMFEAWVNDLRADVYGLTGDVGDQSLPVLVGEISYSYNPGDMEKNPAFIAMQNEMANTIENLYVINQSPLATANNRGDAGHWSCDDMFLIGQMIGTTALNELVLDEEATKYEMPYLIGTPVAEVYDAEGTLLGTYSSLSWAVNTAPAGATVKLLSDLTLHGPLGFNNPNKVTVDGQSFMIDSKSTTGDALKLIATDITLKNFNIKAHSAEWGLQTYRGAKFIWNGGSFEAESIGIVMNDNAIGQLHNVNVSVRNGVETYSAAIYMGDQNADIWVNNSTVTASGTAEAIRAINGYVTVTGNSVITGGTNTTYAISQRDFNGYLAIENSVTVNGVIVNNGLGYFTGEDYVELPTPELPEDEDPTEPELPADPDLPEPETPEEITPVDPEDGSSEDGSSEDGSTESGSSESGSTESGSTEGEDLAA